jgi:hypothetical protein
MTVLLGTTTSMTIATKMVAMAALGMQIKVDMIPTLINMAPMAAMTAAVLRSVSLPS